MLLELFIWSWINLHPRHVLKTLVKFLGMAALVLLPLIYLNASLAHDGFKLTAPSFHLQPSEHQGDY